MKLNNWLKQLITKKPTPKKDSVKYEKSPIRDPYIIVFNELFNILSLNKK
jgi:hypothetical protein